MKPSPTFFNKTAAKILLTATGCVVSATALNAETIFQAVSGTAQIGWNDPTLWGNGTDPVVNTNTYETLPGWVTSSTDAVVNGKTWAYTGMVRTSGNGGGAQALSTTFSGNSLTLNENTRLLGKNYSASTATANIVLNGGYINYAVDSAANNSSATLAGTISFGVADLGALFMIANSNYTLNVASTITGDSSKMLQLSMAGGTGRNNQLVILGDMSGFFGTIWTGVAASGTGPNSFFSIQTNAINATLQLDTSSANFHYNLQTNQSFASLIVDGTTLGAGTYDAAYLNGLAPNKFTDGGGSITVAAIPEPGVTALCGLGILVGIAQILRRRTA